MDHKVADTPYRSNTGSKRLGVIGSFVWDIIHGRDPREEPVEEWGGITYALGALDAALPDDWEIVPIMKVGSDLSQRAREFLKSLDKIKSSTLFWNTGAGYGALSSTGTRLRPGVLTIARRCSPRR